ncbi:hypothetical protein HF1_00630 [Mycoplasma haemofelis str. Langford 1]|uniref:Transmembrane protein n=2 Tax=Mycoplasma haemofelis TaxID=29501 RepID=F6FFJ0_MYCHI|nr:hypothetical protein [Mycoplasma haemofelis]AEG72385.1 hypothetical protein MHF_0072 [Mycoplasma haemofelis Ohio2]CBY92071.1 hypothetical protein HF1_00630 [Mycoplasma haemofelis str. Langford 1]
MNLQQTQENPEFYKLFLRGSRLCTTIFITWVIFFISWFLASSREYVIISNTSSYSKFFYFVNPNIFKQYIWGGNVFNWLFGAVNEVSLIFIISYLVSVIAFTVILISCLILFIVSYHTDVKYFQYIACLGIFPVIGIFLIAWFVFKLWVHNYEMKKKGFSRYQKDFEPEIFEDPVVAQVGFDDVAKRPLTTQFTVAHYSKFFKEEEKKDFLSSFYDWLELKLK